MDRATSANYLRILEKCMAECGVPNFIDVVGFDRSRIQDPSAYLNFDEFSFLLQEAYQRSNCPYLGLLFGEHLSIASHGFLGYAAMTSPTLGAAFQTLLSFLNTRTGLFRGDLYFDQEKSSEAYIKLSLMTEDKRLSQFIIEMAIVHVSKLRQFLLNTIAAPTLIEIAYPDPGYADKYQAYLHTKVRFDAGATKVWLQASELDSPMSFADDISFQQAKEQLQTLAYQVSEPEDLPSRIKKILYDKELYLVSMESIASELCLSPRTLRRHLQRHQLSYQELLDEVRQEKAKHLLTHSSLSITEVSFLLGFNDISNFSKAFKRWTGSTPTEYRETT